VPSKRAAEFLDTAGLIARYPREVVAVVTAGVATLAIFANALFLQNGPHPAPIFGHRAPAPAVKPALPATVAPLPMPAPQIVTPPARPRGQVVTDIQRELAKRGFYDGTLDGVWGAQTDAAARDFVQASGSKNSVEASEEMLRTIAASKIKAPAKAAPPEPPRNDPIAQLLAPDKRVAGIQRALAEFGYGQIRPTGQLNQDTVDAIRRFEAERKMPVTGLPSEQLVRALAAMTGHALE